MSLIASRAADAGEFKSLDAGTYIARCVSIWGIGHQYNQLNDKWKPNIILRWGVPEETTDDGRPLTICGFYTLSLHEKSNLYKTLVAWRGKAFTDDELAGFDLANILGAPCLLTVTVNDNGKTRVGGVSKLGKGMTCPDAVNELETYDMSDDPGGAKYAALPEWVQGQVDQSRERAPVESIDNGRPTATADAGAKEDAADEIPF